MLGELLFYLPLWRFETLQNCRPKDSNAVDLQWDSSFGVVKRFPSVSTG